MKTKIKLNTYSITVIAVWGIAAVGLAVNYVMFKMPMDTQVALLRNQYQESRQEADHAQMAAVPETIKRLENTCGQSKELIHKFTTTQSDITGLVFKIGQIANDLDLSEFSSKAVNGSGYSAISKSKVLSENRLNVEFESSFEQFVRCINQLERSEPVVFIEELFFRRDPNGDVAHKTKLDLSFLTQVDDTPRSVAAADSR